MKSKTLLKILSVLGRQKIYFVFSVLLALINVALTLYVPILVGEAIDCIIGKGNVDFEKIGKIILQIIVSVVITAAAQWLMSVCNNQLTYNLVHDLRSKAFKNLLGFHLFCSF